MDKAIASGVSPKAGEKSEISNRGKWLALTAAILGWTFDGLEMGLFPLVARPALLELMGPAAAQNIGTWFSAIIAVFLVGASLGGVLFGWLGDRVGRTRAMMWSVLTYSIFSGLCAFAQDPWQLAALRFIAALGMGGEWALGVALVMEIWPSRSRPLMAGLIGAAANVGFLLIALLSLGLNSVIAGLGEALRMIFPDAWAEALLANGAWRMLMLMGALPALLTFFIRIFVPESEKWKKASVNAAKPQVADIFRSGLARYTLLGACLGAVALMGTWGSVQWIPSWAHKMTNHGTGVREAVQICLALGAILGTVLIALLAEKTNRRKAYFGLSLLSLFACAYLFRVPMEYGGIFLILSFVVGGLTAGFYGWLPLYLPELFPTRLRATGSGFAFNAGRLLAAGGTMISGQLLNYFNEDYARMASWISLVYILGLVIIWFCPETKGKPLPE